MAKRKTGVGKPRKTRSRKTQKRLAVKYEMLALRRSGLAKKVAKKKK
jgi:hypothetical protein